MSPIRIAASAPMMAPFYRGALRRGLGADRELLIVGGLFLTVLIAEAIFLSIAAPTIPDIDSLYVTVT